MFISFECLPSERLIVSVFDEDTNGSDLIGRCSVALLSKSAAWFELRTDGGDGAPGDVAGQLQLTLMCTPVHLDYNRYVKATFDFWNHFVFVVADSCPVQETVELC